MGPVDNVMKAGDATASLSSKEKSERGNYRIEHKKLNKSLACRTHPLTSLSNGASPIIDKRLGNYVALIQNNVIRVENYVTDVGSCPADYCGYSYYRSCDSFRDHVLMKDVGVSCNLLKLKHNENVLTSAIDKYFFKQIKNEYQEISKYFQSLSKKYTGRSSNFENLAKQPVATEYLDKNGKVCLKLRLKDIRSNVIKEESTVKSIISAFFSSWNFLFPLQQRKENVKEFHRKKCLYVHKKKYRKVRRILLSDSKKSRVEITSDDNSFSYLRSPRYNKYNTGSQEFLIQNSKNCKSIKMEKWKTECLASTFNLYAQNQKMQAVNISFIRHQEKDF